MVLEKILLVHSKLKLWTFFRGHGEYEWPLATSTCTLISCPVSVCTWLFRMTVYRTKVITVTVWWHVIDICCNQKCIAINEYANYPSATFKFKVYECKWLKTGNVCVPQVLTIVNNVK